jgi:hypothetical protein
MFVRCGNRKAHEYTTHHSSVAEVRACFAGQLEVPTDEDWDNGAAGAEQAYERHLENLGYEEAQAQDAYEARNGVVGFMEAWHIESPETCPCDRPHLTRV